MKRYDGRTKPIPKPRPQPAKGKKAKTSVRLIIVWDPNSTSINFLQNSKIPPPAEPHVSTEFMCLMRAVFKNEKISTVVHAKDVNKFQLAYCNLLKSNMDGLKRQKKQKTKKATQ